MKKPILLLALVSSFCFPLIAHAEAQIASQCDAAFLGKVVSKDLAGGVTNPNAALTWVICPLPGSYAGAPVKVKVDDKTQNIDQFTRCEVVAPTVSGSTVLAGANATSGGGIQTLSLTVPSAFDSSKGAALLRCNMGANDIIKTYSVDLM